MKSGFAATLTAALLAAASGSCAASMEKTPQPTAFTDADEALYTARFTRLMEDARIGAGLDSYDPLVPVAGAKKPKPLPVAEQPSLSAEALTAATDYAAARNSSAFIVWRDGAIEQARYFNGFDQDRPIVSKSLAKPVTAILVGRALAQGHIKSLDQPVADFLTEWRDDPQRSKILVRHLLDMRSGLLPQANATTAEDILNRAYLHPRHIEIILGDYPITHRPGTRYEYSNATSELIAPLIERATGQRYEDYLAKALLQPIGAAGGSIWLNRPGGTAHSGCCLLLPAESWLRMAILLMQDGVWEGKRLLPEGYVQAMRTGTAENPHYGLGLWLAGPYVAQRGFAHPSVPFGKVLHSEPYADKDITLFDGNSNQVVYMVPSMNLVILRTGANPPRDKAWDNSFLPNLLIRDAARADGAPKPEPQPR